MTTEAKKIDKSQWLDGPWKTEPDRIEFEHAGLPCLMRRTEIGIWCGYAAVPHGHPLHGKDYAAADVDVHGGLTYADKCVGEICHVPKPGEPDDVWWFGFDCGHGSDVIPGMPVGLSWNRQPGVAYRTADYVRAETERLAEQLAALRTSP